MRLMHAAHDEMCQQQPLVQCLTNAVVTNITANVLLAAGAQPAMCDTPEESFDFAQIASGVIINAGTPSQQQYAGMREAVRGAKEAGTPWVLDPVAAGTLRHRTEFVLSMVGEEPTAIRGNASEIMAIAGLGEGGRGVESTDTVEAALPAAQKLAEETGGVVAVSGPRDLLVSEGRVTWLSSGHPMLQSVIGTGCSLGALTAAYLGAARGAYLTSALGWEINDHSAVLAAHAHSGAAAQLAMSGEIGPVPKGPGTFAQAWLDALYLITEEQIEQFITVEEE